MAQIGTVHHCRVNILTERVVGIGIAYLNFAKLSTIPNATDIPHSIRRFCSRKPNLYEICEHLCIKSNDQNANMEFNRLHQNAIQSDRLNFLSKNHEVILDSTAFVLKNAIGVALCCFGICSVNSSRFFYVFHYSQIFYNKMNKIQF